jgi:hypothetical protein
MSARGKVNRRIVFYTLVLGYVIVQVATRKYDWISYAVFAVASVYALAQFIEDITTLRRSSREL